MKNYVQSGDVITIIAPYALTAGQGALVGSLFGVATCDAANGANVDVMPEGVFDITALQTDTGGAGTKMYWDNAAKRLTTTSTGNTLVGCLTAAKGSSDTTARVYLDGCIR
jgi:predicted RecA/RadA family phage recombinase